MEQLHDQARLAAVEDFDDKTSELTSEYTSIQRQLSAVADELMHARQARIEELLERERLAERMAHLLELLPGAVLVTDADGIVIECNQHAPQLLGRPLVGRQLTEIAARLTDGGSVTESLWRIDGERWLSLSRKALPDNQGEILLLTDVTDTERLRGALARQNRLSAMGEMSARLAHQVRTPLAAAVLYLSQLERVDTTLAVQPAYLSRAMERLHDLERLINDMLMYAGGVHVVDSDVELTAVVDEVVETFSPQLDDPFQLDWQGTDSPIFVRGTRHALFNAISNLVANSLQFTEGDQPVAIRVSREGDYARISIRDHGPGIPEEYHDRIFEPFFSTQSAGTGLGLAVVHSVVIALGGRVAVNDVTDGTEFVVELPLTDTLLPEFSHVNAGMTSMAHV